MSCFFDSLCISCRPVSVFCHKKARFWHGCFPLSCTALKENLGTCCNKPANELANEHWKNANPSPGRAHDPSWGIWPYTVLKSRTTWEQLPVLSRSPRGPHVLWARPIQQHEPAACHISTNKGTSLLNFLPNSGLRKICNGISVVATSCQLSWTLSIWTGECRQSN